MRRAASLPLSWDVPDDAQISELLARIAALLDGRRNRPDRALVEAIVLILLTMQTGRSRDQLTMLTILHRESLDVETEQAGILLVADGGYIILPPVAASRCTIPLPHHRAVSKYVILPIACPLLRALAMLAPLTAQPAPLFTALPADRDRHVRRLLRGAPDWRTRTAKAGRGLAALRRWLRYRLRIIDGGDPALSMILDPTVAGAQRTLSSYGTISADRFWSAYRTALKPMGPVVHRLPPTALAKLNYGNPFCPDDDVLRTALARITLLADRPLVDPTLVKQWNEQRPRIGRLAPIGPLPIRYDRHLAMMMRCFVAATFVTGQRGIGGLAGIDDVDPETGFAWISEKANRHGGYGGERAVFHTRAVRCHLAVYEDYVDTIEAMLRKADPAKADQLAGLRAEPGILFFDIGRRVTRLSQGDLCKRARLIGWPFDVRAGRRWLRSTLIGAVPSDALAAQFGHHLDGLDVWSEHSGLDPRSVAEVLAPVLHRASSSIGLADPPRTKRRACQPFGDPASAETKTNQRYRAGQILASAIWNGAMLYRSQERELIEQLGGALKQHIMPHRIDLEQAARFNQHRWFIDPRTLALLHACRSRGITTLAGEPDKLLAEFLGSRGAVEHWRAAAIARWRYRLPPILHARARGALANHGVRTERFHPNRLEPVRIFGRSEPRKVYRATGANLIRHLRQHWDGDVRQIWRRKKMAYAGLHATLSDQDFYGQMSPLERSLAWGLVEGLVIDRKRSNPAGYSMTTLIQRAERLWRCFVPLNYAAWEETPIDQLDVGIVREQMIVDALWRSNVANDLIAVLKALPATPCSAATIAELERCSENYTANLLHPTEYRRLKEGLPDADESNGWAGAALTLCYRTGLRFSELGDVRTRRIRSDARGSVMLTLDHDGNRRLKTFHSRRRIPLDILLDDDEREALTARIFNSAHRECVFDQAADRQ